MSVKEITAILSNIGFSSPPALVAALRGPKHRPEVCPDLARLFAAPAPGLPSCLIQHPTLPTLGLLSMTDGDKNSGTHGRHSLRQSHSKYSISPATGASVGSVERRTKERRATLPWGRLEVRLGITSECRTRGAASALHGGRRGLAPASGFAPTRPGRWPHWRWSFAASVMNSWALPIACCERKP